MSQMMLQVPRRERGAPRTVPFKCAVCGRCPDDCAISAAALGGASVMLCAAHAR